MKTTEQFYLFAFLCLYQRLCSLGTQTELHHILVHSDREIVSYITFVKEIHFVLLQVISYGISCNHQVVVGNFGKEKMMGYVTIGDMMVKIIYAKAKFTINCFKCGVHKLPVIIVIDKSIMVMMLQISHSYQPPGVHEVSRNVIIEDIHKILTTHIINRSKIGQHDNRADDALLVLDNF